MRHRLREPRELVGDADPGARSERLRDEGDLHGRILAVLPALGPAGVADAVAIVEKRAKVANGGVRISDLARGVPGKRKARDRVGPLEALISGLDGAGERLLTAQNDVLESGRLQPC